MPTSSVNTYSDIPSLNAIDDHQYPTFDLGIPDQYRVDIWQQSFAKTSKTGNARQPQHDLDAGRPHLRRRLGQTPTRSPRWPTTTSPSAG